MICTLTLCVCVCIEALLYNEMQWSGGKDKIPLWDIKVYFTLPYCYRYVKLCGNTAVLPLVCESLGVKSFQAEYALFNPRFIPSAHIET